MTLQLIGFLVGMIVGLLFVALPTFLKIAVFLRDIKSSLEIIEHRGRR